MIHYFFFCQNPSPPPRAWGAAQGSARAPRGMPAASMAEAADRTMWSSRQAACLTPHPGGNGPGGFGLPRPRTVSPPGDLGNAPYNSAERGCGGGKVGK